MSLFQIGECRVCGKNCLWFTPVDGVLAVFDVCSEECLANCEEAQQCLHPTDGGLSASDNESAPATIGG
jgi:hypothetical protein